MKTASHLAWKPPGSPARILLPRRPGNYPAGYRVAEKAHAAQKRVSGEPYIKPLAGRGRHPGEYSMPLMW